MAMADRAQFEEIALVHLDSVYRAAWTLCANAHDTEELVQATMLKALQRFDSFRTGTNCRAWLLRILKNTWFDELRHRKVVGPTVPVDGAPLEVRPPPEPTVWSNPRDLLANFADAQIIRALRELPDELRLTLYLVDVEGLNYDEVGRIMEIPEGTIKSRTSRARESLRERLEAHARDLGFIGRRE
jgi:RNA polymerase sigma-70 factor (ECF subfamily)